MFDAGLAVIPAQGRVLVVWGAWGTVGLAAHDWEPRPRGSRARYCGSRATKNLHACTLRHEPVGGVPSRVRPIRRFPTPSTQPVRGPAPGLPPGRRQTRVLSSPQLGAPLALCPQRIEKGRIHTPTRPGSPERTPDLTSATCLCVRVARKIVWVVHRRGRTWPRGPSDGGAPGLKPGVNPQKSSTLRGSGGTFLGVGGGTCAAALDNTTQEAASARPGAGRPTGSPRRDTGAKG